MLTTEAEFRYFSGFLNQFWQSPTRPWHLLIPRKGSPVAVIPEIGVPLMKRTWMTMVLQYASFVDASPVIRASRMVKSEAEIAKVAHICRVASYAFDRVPRLAGAGIPLAEVFRAFKIALLEEGADDVPISSGPARPVGTAM